MSSSTSCGIAPFKLESIWQGDSSGPYKPFIDEDWVNKIERPDEFVINGINRWDNEPGFDDSKPYDIGRGWTLQPKVEEYDDLFLQGITKGKFKVYNVNESQYSAGGEIDLSIISKNEASLKEFKKDFNLGGAILKNQKTYQTL